MKRIQLRKGEIYGIKEQVNIFSKQTNEDLLSIMRTMRSVQKGKKKEILDLISKEKLNIREISERINLHYVNCHNYLKWLRGLGLVTLVKQEGLRTKDVIPYRSSKNIDQLYEELMKEFRKKHNIRIKHLLLKNPNS